MERDFDCAARPIELVPQDITWVLLNLIGNVQIPGGCRARIRNDIFDKSEMMSRSQIRSDYDSVQRHVREWRRQQSRLGPVFIPLWFAPGEAYQFGWSHEVVVLGGVTTTVKVAHIRLCHSRMFLVRAYPLETQEMVFDAHDHAFRSPAGPLVV